MSDWIVYNGNDMPDRVLNIRYTIAKNLRYRDIGEVISRTKEQLARSIAQKIIEKPFFHVEDSPHSPFIEVSGSCVVLSLEEYEQRMKDQFKKGMDSGVGVLPPAYCKP